MFVSTWVSCWVSGGVSGGMGRGVRGHGESEPDGEIYVDIKRILSRSRMTPH